MSESYPILIVDDTPENIKLAASILTGKGYEIFFATSAAEALNVLSESDIHLILLDVMMPVMNGYELCRQLRKEGRDFPIIFLTAMHDSDYIVKAFEAGGNDYIMKPFNDLELLARVQNHATLYALKQKLQRELENSIHENEIQKTLLLQREKMAQMGDAFSMIAHQWKQPLSAIASVCNLVSIKEQLGMQIDPEISDYFKSIASKVQHLSETINIYKAFFKPNQQKERIEIVPLLEESLLIYKELFMFYHITVISHYESKPVAFVIANEITQTLLILLQNSMDELVSKNIKGTIELKAGENGEYIIIEVKDNAGGIPGEIIDKIFDINYTSKGEHGSGLGLYIAKTIIEEHHNGKLEVVNNQEGAVFTIRIPKENKAGELK